ncbi:MAG TPA: SDR family NAD(P)-dependent oxidoreductase [Pirellulales bacterium]|nr:SDR family NAD(P)-dependent oxidoreductase [Pirellulales bacterium]
MKGSCALVTGASAGFGWAIAEQLAARGANLLITGRREERLQALKEKIVAEHQVLVEPLVFDVRSLTQCEAALKQKASLVANVSILINNAGLAKGVDQIQSGDIKHWDQMIDTNIKGLLHMTRLVLPYMIQRNAGHIVNLGSIAGHWVAPGGAVYCATKFAVRAITDGMRIDLAGKNIRVTNIEPGIAETEFAHVRMEDDSKADAVYKGITPLTAHDIAEAVIWCLERPPHVNVHELLITPLAQVGVGPAYVHRQ